MGKNIQENMKKFASFRSKIDIDSQEDLLNGLMSQSEKRDSKVSQPREDQLCFDYSEEDEPINDNQFE